MFKTKFRRFMTSAWVCQNAEEVLSKAQAGRTYLRDIVKKVDTE